jgi:hypothetical protein
MATLVMPLVVLSQYFRSPRKQLNDSEAPTSTTKDGQSDDTSRDLGIKETSGSLDLPIKLPNLTDLVEHKDLQLGPNIALSLSSNKSPTSS